MMRFTVESWAPEYGVAADAADLEDSTAQVDVDVEMPAAEWRPLRPDPALAPDRLVFVDGVRRIDARVWIVDGESAHVGVCASVAAGAVRCVGDRATVVAPSVLRGLFVAGSTVAAPIVTRHGTYELVPCAGDSPEDLYNGIHEAMTALETGLDLYDAFGSGGVDPVGRGDGVDRGHVGGAAPGSGVGSAAEVVVFDGPLRGRSDPRGVGFVKTQAVQYLPDDQQRVLARLGAGERTPLFLIGGRGFTRWSWYLRLPGPVDQPLAALVRCELPGLGGAADAASRADAVSAALPRFASEAHKDSRAPQNLYPIAGLEHQLRHRLGDPAVLERSLRLAAR